MSEAKFRGSYETLGNPNYPYRSDACSTFSYENLAEIYNETRIDYIVPMPMNAKRLEEYVTNYDINLDASLVIYNLDGLIAGIGMLGIRSNRAWISRLGVVPQRRNHKIGQFMMEYLIKQAHQLKTCCVQLEVIKGNAPAHQLFLKLGFKETRELLVIRRSPSQNIGPSSLPIRGLRQLNKDEIGCYLHRCQANQAWTEEPASLLHIASLRGFELTAENGEMGWVIFEFSPFQLTHLTLAPHASPAMAQALLHQLHTLYPNQDSKVENVPARHRHWEAYQAMGYIEVFRRREMFLTL